MLKFLKHMKTTCILGDVRQIPGGIYRPLNHLIAEQWSRTSCSYFQCCLRRVLLHKYAHLYPELFSIQGGSETF